MSRNAALRVGLHMPPARLVAATGRRPTRAGSNVVPSRQSANGIPASRRAGARRNPFAPPCRQVGRHRRNGSRRRMAIVPHAPRRLHQQPAQPRVAGLGERAPALPLPGAVLPRHQPEVGRDVAGPREPRHVVERRHVGHRRHGAHAGRRGEPPRDRIRRQPRATLASAAAMAAFSGAEQLDQRGHDRRLLRRQRHPRQASRERRRAPARHPDALAAQHRPDHAQGARARPHQRLAHRGSARTARCAADVRCAARYAPSRHASASVRASRRSVFTRRDRVAYIAA